MVDTESPFSVYSINPNTFRKAWMHDFCFVFAVEELHAQKASTIKYLDRHDEYITKFA